MRERTWSVSSPTTTFWRCDWAVSTSSAFALRARGFLLLALGFLALAALGVLPGAPRRLFLRLALGLFVLLALGLLVGAEGVEVGEQRIERARALRGLRLGLGLGLGRLRLGLR